MYTSYTYGSRSERYMSIPPATDQEPHLGVPLWQAIHCTPAREADQCKSWLASTTLAAEPKWLLCNNPWEVGSGPESWRNQLMWNTLIQHVSTRVCILAIWSAAQLCGISQFMRNCRVPSNCTYLQCAFPVSDTALKSVRPRDHRSLEQKGFSVNLKRKLQDECI